ncbi:Formyltransferase [Amylocystis lapponica]|nr:Formyltransferase [Amylocystis lapponica]
MVILRCFPTRCGWSVHVSWDRVLHDIRAELFLTAPLKTLGNQRNIPVHTIPPDKRSFKLWQPPPPFFYAPTVSTIDPSNSSAVGRSPPPEHLLVTASFGRILPTSLLELFLPARRLNIHPSLLPAYRGAAPIQHTLLDGRMRLGCRSQPIPDGSMFPALRDTLAREGGELLVSVLRDMLSGKAYPSPQRTDLSAPRAPMIKTEDAILDFATTSAESIVARHRAISHQKPLVAYLKTKKTLQLHSPAVCTSPPPEALATLPSPGLAIYHATSASLLIRCASDSILAVPQVKQQDRALLKAKEWWNGVRSEMRSSHGETGPVQFLIGSPSN